MQSNYKSLGNYIREVNVRNTELKVDKLMGVSIQKELMPSIANTVGTNMRTYKILKKRQFAYGPVTSRNGDKISVALLEDYDEVIISQAYTSFEIINIDKLLPEYLMMWFRRPEFDRYARFMSHGSAREVFGWEELCNTKLPVPSIETQCAIVAEYNIVKNRIALNNQLIQKLEETAQAIYKQWFVDFEFPFDFTQGKPDENGKPYKSSGGKMVFNEELEKEIPEGWRIGEIIDLFILQRGHDLPTQDRIKGEYPIFASTGIAEFHNDYKVDKPTIITGRSGSLGELFYYDQPCWPLNTTLYVKEFSRATPFYSLYFLQTVSLKELGAGSAVPTLNRNDIHALPKELPIECLMRLFDKKASIIHSNKKNYELEIKKLEEFKNIILSRLSTIEN